MSSSDRAACTWEQYDASHTIHVNSTRTHESGASVAKTRLTLTRVATLCERLLENHLKGIFQLERTERVTSYFR